MARLRKSIFLLLLAWIGLGFTNIPQAQSGFNATNVNISYDFGRQITFLARLTSAVPIQQAFISFREVDEQTTRVVPLVLSADGSTSYRYDASQHLIPPFATIEFSYQATLIDNQSVTTGPFYFRYADNRFPWKDLGAGPVTVHWYDGDDAFGQAALDAARAGLQNISQTLPVSLSSPVDVYIYSNFDDLVSALSLGGRQWEAGHADPSIGVGMLTVAPGDTQTIDLQRLVPHELTHIMLYRSLGDGFNRLPTWLEEGIASMEELYPNPDYASALEAASKDNSLLSFDDLCTSFPADSGRAYLAFAESQSFVRFLRNTYGNTGIVALTRAYADGLDCDLGATRAVGVPLDQLEARWRESVLGQNLLGAAGRNLLPYLIILSLTLIVPVWGAIGVISTGRKNAR
ncbi:MAG TPA: peptidase MA family metallohydrolase [Anaerolineales bacterium]|nr:peptidase MA family metallohydrolase [Anaerolineales bacterium]